ncbi:MAG TPA: PaaI family thioesterase [Rubrobacter sp.]
MKAPIGRTRTVSWEDPAPGAEAARNMSGLEYLRAMMRGELPAPPMAALMGFGFVEIDEGRVVFECVPAEYHYNPIGAVHGGLACTLFDSAMGCAVHTELPAGVGYTTIELKVNLLRPITVQSGRLLCEGETIHVGGRIATAEARLKDKSGRLYGHATTTCMIFREGSKERSVGEGG